MGDPRTECGHGLVGLGKESSEEMPYVRHVVGHQQGHVDGVRSDGEGGYIISDFGGRVFRVDARGGLVELINTTASGARAADLEYVADLDLLVVPGLFDNLITAYRCDIVQTGS